MLCINKRLYGAHWSYWSYRFNWLHRIYWPNWHYWSNRLHRTYWCYWPYWPNWRSWPNRTHWHYWPNRFHRSHWPYRSYRPHWPYRRSRPNRPNRCHWPGTRRYIWIFYQFCRTVYKCHTDSHGNRRCRYNGQYCADRSDARYAGSRYLLYFLRSICLTFRFGLYADYALL